mgnify:CR=1 FL=1
MTIDDIKDINKLRAMLKESQREVKCLKECCKQAGLELAKNINERLQAKNEELLSQEKVINRLIKQVDHWRGTSITDSQDVERLSEQLQAKEKECEELKKEKEEIKKYLGISDKTIMQRFEELQEFKDELKISEYNYKQALDDIEKVICKLENTSILTFSDFSKEENLKIVMKQCNSGYIEIQNIINKAKENENE